MQYSYYEEGCRAFHKGITVNPYPNGSDEWYEWDQGWVDEELAQEDKDESY